MFVDVIRASIHDRDKSTIREIAGCLLSAMFVDVIRASIHDRDKSTIREIAGCLLSAMFVDVIRASIHDRDRIPLQPITLMLTVCRLSHRCLFALKSTSIAKLLNIDEMHREKSIKKLAKS